MPLANTLRRLRQLPSAWLAACVVCAAFSGCELNRPNFQMNSNSPTPFFGFDILPRRRTTSIVSPRAGQQVASAVSSSVETVDDSPSRSRFWKRNAKSLGNPSRTVVLPLSRPDADHIIDRGPVELLP